MTLKANWSYPTAVRFGAGRIAELPDACKVSGVSCATFYRRVADLQLHLRMFGFRSAAGSPHITPLRKNPASAGKNIHTPRFFAAAN